MSSTAFKRDLADPKTIEDFVQPVQSPERLRLLLILTVVDIRAVGPGVWNDWKRQLLRSLVRGRRGAAPSRPQAAWPSRAGRGSARQSSPPRWAGSASRARPCPAPARQLLARRAARLADRQCPAGRRGRGAYRRSRAERRRGRRRGQRRDARQRLHARPRRPVLPHLRGARRGRREHHRRAHPHHARRHGARQSARPDGQRPALCRPPAAQRLAKAVEAALDSRSAAAAARAGAAPAPDGRLRGRPVGRDRRPGSTRTTVVEVNARDRPACSPAWRRRSTAQGHRIHSAHIATYGERAVDVFYLTRRRRQEAERRRRRQPCARRSCSRSDRAKPGSLSKKRAPPLPARPFADQLRS